MSNTNRFIKLENSFCGGTKLFSRRQINTSLNMSSASDMIYFLRKLWTVFGKPQFIDDGFNYCIKDSISNIVFSAYSSSSGPSYGAAIQYYEDISKGEVKKEVLESIKFFDYWVESLPLSENYEIEYYIDIEYRTDANTILVEGMKNGIPYKFKKLQ